MLCFGACGLMQSSVNPNGLTPTQATFVTACQGYNGALTFMTKEYQAKKVTPAQIASINQIRTIVFPICSNTQALPTYPMEALNTVLNAISQIEAIQNTLKP